MSQVAGSVRFHAGAISRTRATIARALRLVAALVLAIPVVATVAGVTSVSATTSLVPKTAFEIDGNLPVTGNGGVPNVSSAGDWGVSTGTAWSGGTYGPGLTPGGFPSTGSYYMYRDMDACDSSTDTIGVGGKKVDDGPAWAIAIGNVLDKGDVKSVSLAAEKVDVNGQINDIVYAAFELCQDAGGSFNAVLYFDDGDGVPPSAGDNGDYVILFDFKSAQVGGGELYQRIGGIWVSVSKDGTKIDTFATGLVGEAAINLTTLGILPGAPGAGGTPPACRTIQVGGQAATISGYSTGSQLKDIVGVTPLDLSNCGPLKVKKLSNATDPTTEFGYDVVRANGGAVHDTTLGVTGGAVTTEPDANINEIDATINVGETHTWTNVISQPNYKITEDAPPVGWALVSISCTYPNIFAAPVGGVYPTATSVIYTANAYTAATFLVPPSIIDLGGASPLTLPAAECTMTNNVTGIKIVKTGTGDPSTLFNFADNSGTPKVANLTIVDNPATPAVVENATTFKYAANTAVVITETIPATTPAWTLTSIACVRADGTTPVGVFSLPNKTASVTTVAGEVITCTYTNNQKGRITVAKIGTGNTAQSFPFEQSWDGNTDTQADFNLTIGGAATNSGDLAPGVYTVQELLPVTTPAWVLASVVCTDTAAGSNGSSTVVAGPLATVTLAAGDTVNCVYNNTQKGHLVIIKNTVGGNDTFAFSGPVPSVTTAGGTGTAEADVTPGVFSVVETVPSGWDLTGSSCNSGETLPNVTVGTGETVTCTFTNTKRGKITVEKQTTPNGSTQQFGFEASWNGAANQVADFSLADNGTQSSDLIVPGTYSVAELGLTGWDMTGATCTDGSPVTAISLQAGEEITCTFNNTQRGTITVEKQTTPASAQLFGFEASWNGAANLVADFSLADNGTQSSGPIVPGTYSVSELALTGWDLTSATCNDGSPVTAISLQPGENITCTFNNTQRGNIRIIKQSGVSGGTFNYTGTWAGAATFQITTTGVTPNFTGQAYYPNVAPGTYTVTEVAPFGDFDLKNLSCVESSGDGFSSPVTPVNQAAGTIDLDPGETVTCTYNNTKRGVIVIEKDAVPNLPDDFSFTGDAPVGNFNLDDDGSNLNTLANSKTVTGVTSTDVAGATYTVTEGVTDGWNLTGLTCSNASVVSTVTRTAEIEVGPGETVTCKFTNTAITPTLIINKTAVGGDRAFNFDVTNLAGSPLVVTTTGGSGSSALTNLVPGVSYTVSEQLLTEWIEGTLTCEIDPAGVVGWTPINGTTFIAQPGAAYRCKITNTKLGRIIIDKVTVPTGSPVSFDFNASWDTGTDPDFSLTDAAAPADSGFTLTPNTSYTVTEVGKTGWSLTAASCSDGSGVVPETGVATINLAPGEVVTCTYTNSQRGAVSVLKTASVATAVAGQPTQWNVTYTVTVTSVSQIAELYDLVDSFAFGTGITVVSTSATGPNGAIGTFTGGASAPGNVLATAVSIPALGQHVYTINVRVTVAGSSADRDCTLGGPERGTLNTATVTSQDSSSSSSACALIPDPAITVVKSVVSEPVRNANGTLTIVYGIAVTNAAGAGNGTYNVIDTFGFGTGITVVSKAVTASPLGVTINPAYATTPADNNIATGVIIGPGLLTHLYQVTVTVSVIAAPTTDGDCSAEDPSTGLLNTVTVTVDGHPGDDDTICRPVSTLRLVKAVVNDNGGNLTPADVTLTAKQGATTVLTGTASIGGAVLPGDYDLAENPFPVPGYTASAWNCVGGSATGATVTVGSATNVVCTITNDDIAPTVTLIKIVQNDDGGTAAAGDFSLQIDGTTRTQNAAIPVTANAPHTVGELPKAGYEQVSLVCVNAAQQVLLNPFTPNEGDVITCTITNADLTPRIRLVKAIVNDDGGQLLPGAFSLTLDNVVKTQNVFVDVDANLQLTVSELAVAGYVPTKVVCTSNLGRNTTINSTATISLTPALDEDITCTITNTDVPPGLTVIKAVTNDNGGNAVVANFPLQVNGNTVTSGVPATYPANLALAITETQLAGYTATSTVCTSTVTGSANAKTVNNAGGTTVTLAPGEAVICTITNDDIAPTITVIKSLTNNDGGNAVVADFVLNLGAATVTSGTVNTVAANTSYLVSEVQIPGYTQTSLVCVNGTTPVDNPVVANEGDNIVCTITNNDIAPKITVNKVVVNNNGGKALVSAFNLYLNHLLVVAPVTSGTAHTVLANTSYTVSEDQIAGYAQSGLVVCVNGVTPVAYPVVANEGDNIVCTITNDDIAPTITVNKVVVNNDGGTAVVSDFVLKLGAGTVTSGTATMATANTPYIVSEDPFAGYAPTGVVCVSNLDREDSAENTGTITVTPELGENIVCTITNSDLRPGLTVVKNVINNNGGNAVVSNFVLKVGATTVTSGATNTYAANTNLVISELQLPGYTATGTVCVSTLEGGNNVTNAVAGATVKLLPGETVVCTITNDDKPVDLKITKDDGGANPILGGAFNYTLTITNLGTRDPDASEPIVVTDLLPAGLLFSTPLPAGCVAAGQTLTCTLAAADLGPGETVVLTIPVTVSLTATAGTVTNKAFVTTDDDPACVGECTPPPPCPVVASRVELVSNPSNNVDCEDTPIRAVADLAIVKTVSDATPTPGQSFDWILTVTNVGPNVARDVTINDVVPASLVVTAVASTDFECIRVGNSVSCARASLAVGASGTIRITVLLPLTTSLETTIVNVAQVTGSVFDPDLSNNTSRAVVIPEPPVVLPPIFEKPPVIPETGSDAASGLLLGLLMVLFGGVASVVARRRARQPETNA